MLLVGSDIFQHFRFPAPDLPVLVVLSVAAITDAAPPMSRAHLMLAAALFLSLLCHNGIYSRAQLAALRSANGLPDYGVTTGILIERHTAADTRIAVVATGNTPYLSRRYAIDLLGKSDRHVARTRGQ